MYVNPVRLLNARQMRGLTIRELAEKIGETPKKLSEWEHMGGYKLDLTQEQINRVRFATNFPQGYFLAGDEEEECASHNDIAAQLARELGETPAHILKI